MRYSKDSNSPKALRRIDGSICALRPKRNKSTFWRWESWSLSKTRSLPMLDEGDEDDDVDADDDFEDDDDEDQDCKFQVSAAVIKSRDLAAEKKKRCS